MDTLKGSLALAVAAALALPGAVQASPSNFKYAYINFMSVDVDYSQRFIDAEGNTLGRLQSDSDTGFEIAGAWEFSEGFHLFGLYNSTDQELEYSGSPIAVNPPIPGGDRVKGSFEVNRWRVGLGYSMSMAPEWDVYGRVTYDYSEVASLRLGDSKFRSADDNGIGGELGAIYTLSPQLQFQGHVRYTAVGETGSKVNNDGELVVDFDDDWLIGLSARYFFTERFALQAGYESGNVNTFNIGGRFRF